MASDVIERLEVCSLPTARRVAAMLDQEPDAMHEGLALPRGWQFILLGADTPRKALRSDGFPGLGVPIPDLGLPRLMLAGRTVDYLGDIPIGATLRRSSRIEDIVEKNGPSGPMALLTVGHRLKLRDELVLTETQTYALLAADRGRAAAKRPEMAYTPAPGSAHRTIVPDETLLFQYSALGFNSHKIHINRQYAQEVEALPDLVVNGGLITLLMTQFVRHDLAATPSRLQTRHLAPLYCDRPLTIVAEKVGLAWRVSALDDQGLLCARMEVETQ
ncbi:MaoC family dehydratase N-terminal domain-containing protein [Variovorax sp. N23]|uniref:FAS1-like dehydratase domain-containing protein n=1 Tax=Variovorax sp. N23 TaxID=2980555 RepID=UPI0021C9EBE4|nr:MaoC family dehydratase N-terminal domain-containing protein [Variovorax sp. N23]MCU4118960.1 MaoC family dehydratase N-terminal domain-containing protein [Variovorax sp. N23]